MPFGRSLRKSENVSGLLQSESCKKTQLHDFRSFGFFLSELLQRFVDKQQRVIISVGGDFDLFQSDSLPTTTALAGRLAPRVINEDVAHRFGCCREKMGTVGE